MFLGRIIGVGAGVLPSFSLERARQNSFHLSLFRPAFLIGAQAQIAIGHEINSPAPRRILGSHSFGRIKYFRMAVDAGKGGLSWTEGSGIDVVSRLDTCLCSVVTTAYGNG